MTKYQRLWTPNLSEVLVEQHVSGTASLPVESPGSTVAYLKIRTQRTGWAENFNMDGSEVWEKHVLPPHLQLSSRASERCYLSCGWLVFPLLRAISAGAVPHTLPPGASPQTTETQAQSSTVTAEQSFLSGGLLLLFFSLKGIEIFLNWMVSVRHFRTSVS